MQGSHLLDLAKQDVVFFEQVQNHPLYKAAKPFFCTLNVSSAERSEMTRQLRWAVQTNNSAHVQKVYEDWHAKILSGQLKWGWMRERICAAGETIRKTKIESEKIYGKANDYYKAKNYSQAKACFEEALQLNPLDARCLDWLGWMATYGQGMPKDLAKARSYYEHYFSLVEKNWTASDWYNQAENYYRGRVPAELGPNYVKAYICYLKAFKSDPEHLSSIYSLGWLYEQGEGVTKDVSRAIKFYGKAARKGHAEARKQLKKVERVQMIENAKVTLDYINQKDRRGNTPLHRAVKNGLLRYCAVCLFLGADKEVKNNKNKTPFEGISAKTLHKVTRLQNAFVDLVDQLAQEPSKILQECFRPNNSGLDEEKTKRAFQRLYSVERLKPLLELAQLTALGHHDLANREKYKDGYDSDQDDEEKVYEHQKFKIRVDTKKDTVEGIFHYGEKGLEGKKCNGVYYQGENVVYCGGNRLTKRAVRATLIHELAHFITYAVFKNGSNPFYENSAEMKRYEEIVHGLEMRKETLDPIFQQVFNLYKATHYSSECIVRVSEILVTYPDGLKKLQDDTPELLDYYDEIFLPAVKSHIDKIKKRALSEWPLDLLTRDRQNGYFP